MLCKYVHDIEVSHLEITVLLELAAWCKFNLFCSGQECDEELWWRRQQRQFTVENLGKSFVGRVCKLAMLHVTRDGASGTSQPLVLIFEFEFVYIRKKL